MRYFVVFVNNRDSNQEWVAAFDEEDAKKVAIKQALNPVRYINAVVEVSKAEYVTHMQAEEAEISQVLSQLRDLTSAVKSFFPRCR